MDKKSKNIYEFIIERETTEKVESKKTDKNGEEVISYRNKKVKTPVKFVIKKPTRRMIDAAEEYFSIQLSKNVKKGIVTKAMLSKKYADTGGALTEDEGKEMVRAVQKSNELSNKIKMLLTTKGDENEIAKLEEELLLVRKNLVDLETSLQGVYSNTADSRAERSTLIWYSIHLAKYMDEGQEKDYFKGIIYDDRLEDMYEKDESGDPFDEEALNKIMRVVSYWHYTGDTDKEKIDEFIKT